jgi:hypothetical protein
VEDVTPLSFLSLFFAWRQHLQFFDAASFGQLKPVLENPWRDGSAEPQADLRSVIADLAQVLCCFQCSA